MTKLAPTAVVIAVLSFMLVAPVLAWEEEHGDDGWISSNTGKYKHYFVPITVEEYRLPDHNYSYYWNMDVSEAAWDAWEAAGFEVIYAWCDPDERLVYANTDGFSSNACVAGDANGPAETGLDQVGMSNDGQVGTNNYDGGATYTVKTARLSINHVTWHSCPNYVEASHSFAGYTREARIGETGIRPQPTIIVFSFTNINRAEDAGVNFGWSSEQEKMFTRAAYLTQEEIDAGIPDIPRGGSIIAIKSTRFNETITAHQRNLMLRFLSAEGFEYEPESLQEFQRVVERSVEQADAINAAVRAERARLSFCEP